MSPPVRLDMQRWPLTAVRCLVEGIPDGVIVLNAAGQIALHNQAAAALLGVPADALTGERPLEDPWTFLDRSETVMGGDDHPLAAAVQGDLPVTRQSIGIVRAGSRPRWVHLAVRPLGELPDVGHCHAIVLERAPDPRVTQDLYGLTLDLTGSTSDRSIEALFGQSVIGMVHVAIDGRIVQCNDAFATMLGTTAPALAGRSMLDLTSEEDLERERLTLRSMVNGGRTHHAAEFVLRRVDGTSVTAQFGISAIRSADGACEALVCQVTDVSRLRRAEDVMSRRALFDPLTQLINRTLLIDLLGDQLRVRQNPFAVVAINVDRFKAVNDSLGQSTGDGVLVQIAERLRGTLQPGDAAARIAGDDFVLLCGNVRGQAQADSLTQRVLAAVAEPIEIDGLRIQLTASAGVSLIAPGSGLSGDEVLTQATQALKHAKEQGRARWKVYDQEMRSSSTDRLRIETSLRTALDDGLMRVAYQPLRDLRTERITGAEALLRWHDPFLGPVEPPVFLPVAEDTGMIVPLGGFVLAEAVAAVAQWRDQTGEPLCVSVNLSPHELNRSGITERVVDALDAARLPSTALRFEITETVLVHADEQVRRNITDLHAIGIAVGIDDFGTGYASMSYLKALPLDFVKIDRSFVAGVGTSREDRAIVRATLELAHALNLTTIAEGIESTAQLEILTELGCDWGQGYLIGQPDTPAAMLEHFVT